LNLSTNQITLSQTTAATDISGSIINNPVIINSDYVVLRMGRPIALLKCLEKYDIKFESLFSGLYSYFKIAATDMNLLKLTEDCKFVEVQISNAARAQMIYGVYIHYNDYFNEEI
jgi:hypothetical protein